MKSFPFVVFMLGIHWVFAQAPTAMVPDANMNRPIAAYNTVFIEEMTWLEVRDTIKEGKTTVIIATGGIEQNGLYLAQGKPTHIGRPSTLHQC